MTKLKKPLWRVTFNHSGEIKEYYLRAWSRLNARYLGLLQLSKEYNLSLISLKYRYSDRADNWDARQVTNTCEMKEQQHE